MALELNPPVAAAMAAAGCDFVDHGWRWIDYHDVDIDVEREHIRRSVEVISHLTGSRPLGWYVGPPSPNTRRLVVDEGGFLYDSDAYNDELPYWNHEFGRPHLIIPHTLDDNDTRLASKLSLSEVKKSPAWPQPRPRVASRAVFLLLARCRLEPWPDANGDTIHGLVPAVDDVLGSRVSRKSGLRSAVDGS
jgi:peptidoglycan/xylan/chitin deacetylase (PgdA/CDA1 family)